MTGRELSAERVMGVMNSFPAGVMTICTSAPLSHEKTRQDGGLVCRDTPRDTEDDVLTAEDAHYSLRVSW